MPEIAGETLLTLPLPPLTHRGNSAAPLRQ